MALGTSGQLVYLVIGWANGKKRQFVVCSKGKGPDRVWSAFRSGGRGSARVLDDVREMKVKDFFERLSEL